MLRASSGTDEKKPEDSKLRAEVKSAVRTELEMMLGAPVFAQSSRCKRFLSYVVLETLSGNVGQLKERTIGIAVFNRPSNYDTGGDSIVRVTANEVRKRIDQFYRESRGRHPIQIELPKGAYVPEFRIQTSRRGNEIEENVASDFPDREVKRAAKSGRIRTRLLLSFPRTSWQALNLRPHRLKNLKDLLPARWPFMHCFWFCFWVPALRSFRFGKIEHRRRVLRYGQLFLHRNTPILICVDTHDLHLPNTTSSLDGQRLVDQVLHKQILALDDVAVVSSMAGILGKKDIPFRVVGASQTSLTEFRRQPVILIGAIDNKWTLLLSQSLRYRIEIENPPGSGSGKEPIVLDHRLRAP